MFTISTYLSCSFVSAGKNTETEKLLYIYSLDIQNSIYTRLIYIILRRSGSNNQNKSACFLKNISLLACFARREHVFVYEKSQIYQVCYSIFIILLLWQLHFPTIERTKIEIFPSAPTMGAPHGEILYLSINPDMSFSRVGTSAQVYLSSVVCRRLVANNFYQFNSSSVFSIVCIDNLLLLPLREF